MKAQIKQIEITGRNMEVVLTGVQTSKKHPLSGPGDHEVTRYHWRGVGMLMSKAGKGKKFRCALFCWNGLESERSTTNIRDALIGLSQQHCVGAAKTRAHQRFVSNVRKQVLKAKRAGEYGPILISRDNSWY
jgi:hypothetical protein